MKFKIIIRDASEIVFHRRRNERLKRNELKLNS